MNSPDLNRLFNPDSITLVGVQMLAWGVDEGVGFNKFVSSGNEGDLNSADYLGYLADDPGTRVILAYMEGMGPNLDLLPVAAKASQKKPVLLFKGGRTDAGEKAAASHSGAIAGSNRIFRSANPCRSSPMMSWSESTSSLPPTANPLWPYPSVRIICTGPHSRVIASSPTRHLKGP